MTIFCQTKWVFVSRSSATVKKISEVWWKMGLFGPDSVTPNQLHFFTETKLIGCHAKRLFFDSDETTYKICIQNRLFDVPGKVLVPREQPQQVRINNL